MTNFESLYTRWDEFLRAWPPSRLATMTLDEYVKAGSKDTFTYWIESRLDGLGSIWGGSSFKFGVFSRRDKDEKVSNGKLSYSATHGWYTSLGGSAKEAFEKVREYVCQIADLAARGDLDGIDGPGLLGEAYRWKIAFHYQDRRAPCIVDVFTQPPLAAFAGTNAGGSSMAALQRAAMALNSQGMGVLEFGQKIWGDWSNKNLAVWKLSHGNKDFTEAERQKLADDGLAVMHGDTGAEQGSKFPEVPVGTLFYLCHGNSPQRLAQFTSRAEPSPKGLGWLQRSYRVLRTALLTSAYEENAKKWSPRGNSTFWMVGRHDLPEFEQTILRPYFETDLAELAGLAGDPPEAASLTIAVDTNHQTDEGLLRRFDSKPAFATFRASWNDQERALFCRLARAVHGARLDWWHLSKGVQLRFGRKQPNSERAVGVLGIVRGTRGRTISWTRPVGSLTKLHREPLTQQVVEQIEAALASAGDAPVENWLAAAAGRPGLWPDQLHDDAPGLDDDADEELPAVPAATIVPFNRIYYGPPGTGKTYTLCQLLMRNYGQSPEPFPDDVQRQQPTERHAFVTFHQSFGYEEFVEGLRPVLDGEAGSGTLRYQVRPGVLKELCRRARQDPHQRFALFIDEINRGNVSKIFGELITLIEPDKREGAEHQVTVKLPYSGESFSMPPNVDIIGTMNTADRSLALLDTALRRRFEFVPMLPNVRDIEGAPLHGLRVASGGTLINIPRMLAAINARIEALYDRDHCIGHAYFTPLAQVSDEEARFVELSQVFRNRVLPLLEEYFFEDWRKIRLVLADNQKPHEACFVVENNSHDAELDRLFGHDHQLEAYGSTQRTYEVKEAAFSRPEAYVGIYETLS
jgi:5-methylcytosine-specific restriction protein B